MYQVEVIRSVDAPIDSVWEIYTDHLSWSRWAGLGKVSLARTGVPLINGVGCVRVFSNLGFKVHEEVLSFEPPRRMTYRVIRGGLPMKGHLGEVTFERQDNRTVIRWRCQFMPTIPGIGGALRWLITTVFARVLDRLATELRSP